ncbi:MAG: hypothetical protein HC812_01000 [Leptolyngbya sp. RL_3_1]|nr:hypothetical protein [Leptolyngbya sp. RL_3_1]
MPTGSPRYGLGVESNAAPFILRPTVESAGVALAERDDDDLFTGAVVLQLNLPVDPQQRLVLFLNELSVARPVSYVFGQGVADASHARQITIPFKKLQPGDYLVRVQVDGAESQLVIDDVPGSPTENRFVGPRVTVA